MGCYALYARKTYGVRLDDVITRRFDLNRGVLYEHTPTERSLDEILAYVKGSIADMLALLENQEENTSRGGEVHQGGAAGRVFQVQLPQGLPAESLDRPTAAQSRAVYSCQRQKKTGAGPQGPTPALTIHTVEIRSRRARLRP